jgi:hypothetical protein
VKITIGIKERSKWARGKDTADPRLFGLVGKYISRDNRNPRNSAKMKKKNENATSM